MQEIIWLLIKYAGLITIVGFILGTALSHVIIYARHYGQNSPIRGFSPAAIFTLFVFAILLKPLIADVVLLLGIGKTITIGIASLLMAMVIGFLIRWRMGIGPMSPK